MGDLKALGPDGMPTLFLQEVLGDNRQGCSERGTSSAEWWRYAGWVE